MAIDEIIATYFRAWNEPDDDARARLLEACWAEDGKLTGPQYERTGRAPVAAQIGEFLRQYSGSRIVPTSGCDAHHDVVRFGWRIERGDGSVLMEGQDTGIVGSDGRLARILMFYGPLPSVSEPG